MRSALVGGQWAVPEAKRQGSLGVGWLWNHFGKYTEPFPVVSGNLNVWDTP